MITALIITMIMLTITDTITVTVTVSTARIEWLVELAPHYYDLENWPDGDTKV